MNDPNYTLYQLVDRHPIIAILMLTVAFLWTHGMSRKYVARMLKGDKSARLPEAFFGLCAIWMMVGVFTVMTNHWEAISGEKEEKTYIHGHLYDIISEDSIMHSPLCGCKAINEYLPETDTPSSSETPQDSAKLYRKISKIIRKSAP